MTLPTGDTIGILADNLKLRNSVLPIPEESATRWAQGLDLPRGGETVIYTGMMYQLIPYISVMSKAQGMIEDSPLAAFAGIGRYVNKLFNVSGFMARPPEELKRTYNKILIDIAKLLQKVGAEFGYLYEDELYSGALIYDLGVDDIFKAHTKKVYSTFKRYKVKNVITVDPHTTNMLRSVYPSLIDGFDLNVKSYLEVLAERNLEPKHKLSTVVAIHDSCVYARYENVLKEQRELLAKAGVTVKEPADCGKFTLCCGGPAESLYPKKAVVNAEKRAEQLKQVSGNAVTMCPICLVNLQKAAKGELNIEDVSSYLARACL